MAVITNPGEHQFRHKHNKLKNNNWASAGHTIDADIIPVASGVYALGSEADRYSEGHFDTIYGDGSNLTGIAGGGGATDHFLLTNLTWSTAGHTIDSNMVPTASGTVDLGTIANAFDEAHVNKVYLEGSPVDSLEASTKQYVDNGDTAADAHISSDGSSHTFIDQSVTSGSSPTFTAANFSDGGGKAIVTTTQESNWDNHISDNTQAHSDYLLNNGDDETSGKLTMAGADLGANPLTVNAIEIVGADGEVNAAAIEDKFLRNDGDDSTTGKITCAGVDTGANAITVNAIEVVGSDGEVNKSAVEDSGNWDSAYSHVSNNGTDHSYINQDVTTTGTPTFADATISGDITITKAPSTGDSSGINFTATAGENLTFGDTCYMKSDGKYWKAKADSSTTMPGVVIALETINTDASGSFLSYGAITDSGWSWTVGAIIYVSDATAGDITDTEPNTEDHISQAIGYALSATTIMFTPSLAMTEIAAAAATVTAHYLCNENAADTDVVDTTGNHNATASANTSTIHETGKVGSGAFAFDGSTEILIGDADELSFDGGSPDNPASIAFWMYNSDWSSLSEHLHTIISKIDTTTGDVHWEWGVLMEVDDSNNATMLFEMFEEDNSAYVGIINDEMHTLSSGWHHIALTYDGSGVTGGFTFYVDGSDISGGVDSFGSYTGQTASAADVYVGCQIGSDGNPAYQLEGFWLDDIRIYRSELSSSDVTTLYNGGSGTED